MNEKAIVWLKEIGYDHKTWRLVIRNNGNEFTGPLLQLGAFGPGFSYSLMFYP